VRAGQRGNPPVNSSSQRSSILGIVSARSAQAGRAPMAPDHSSDASTRCPIEAGGEPGGNARPQTSVSIAATSCAPGGSAVTPHRHRHPGARPLASPRPSGSTDQVSANSDRDMWVDAQSSCGRSSARGSIKDCVDELVVRRGSEAFVKPSASLMDTDRGTSGRELSS